MMVDRRFSPTLLKQGHAVGIPGKKQYNRSQINFERCLHKCHSIKRINDLFIYFIYFDESEHRMYHPKYQFR